jgi:hypothetical protein
MRPSVKLSSVVVVALLMSTLDLPSASRPDSPASILEDGASFERLAQATFRWKSIIKVYDIALYLGTGQKAEDVLGDVPKRLELRYHRAFPASEIVRGGDALLRRNVDTRTLGTLAPRLANLNRAYVDVREGDAYALTYVPGRGTSLRLNGRLLATIPGHDFAAAYMSIWLGEKPISVDTRDKLLGR